MNAESRDVRLHVAGRARCIPLHAQHSYGSPKRQRGWPRITIHARTGTTLLEAIAGLAIMLVVFTLVAQMTALTTRQLRTGAMRRLAAQEAANLLDQLALHSTDPLPHADPRAWSLSDEAQRQLPDGQLHVALDAEEAGPPGGMRITVEVSWKSSWGDQREQVRLVSWRYGPQEKVSP